MTRTVTRDAGRHRIEVSRPDKILFPDEGITKIDLVEYYLRIAPYLLPHLRGRPVNMQRFPDGIAGGGFYEKKVPGHFPDWVGRVTVPTSDGSQAQVVCDTPDTLAFLADQACVTPHCWLSTTDHLDLPDQLVFDLDPSVPDTALVQRATTALGELLDDIGLTSFVKTTGSKGFHVHVPLQVGPDFDTTRAFARLVARTLVAHDPERLTLEQRKNKRGDRVFVDVLRNTYAHTAVPPYALRALPGAPVAAPLDWSEVASTAPQRYTIRNIRRRLGQRDDPWHDMDRHRQSLAAARDRIEAR